MAGVAVRFLKEIPGGLLTEAVVQQMCAAGLDASRLQDALQGLPLVNHAVLQTLLEHWKAVSSMAMGGDTRQLATCVCMAIGRGSTGALPSPVATRHATLMQYARLSTSAMTFHCLQGG